MSFVSININDKKETSFVLNFIIKGLKMVKND